MDATGRERRKTLENTSYVPKFSESDVESFFLAFEKVAMALDWPESLWAVTLQKELTGKAQETYSALSIEEEEEEED